MELLEIINNITGRDVDECDLIETRMMIYHGQQLINAVKKAEEELVKMGRIKN